MFVVQSPRLELKQIFIHYSLFFNSLDRNSNTKSMQLRFQKVSQPMVNQHQMDELMRNNIHSVIHIQWYYVMLCMQVHTGTDFEFVAYHQL